jgi:hypothetical protein
VDSREMRRGKLPPVTFACLGDLKIRTTFFVDGCPHLSRLSAGAGNQLQNPTNKETTGKKSLNSNFKTAQGVSGVLVVEVGSLTSSMTLTLQQGQVKYYWQGRSNSEEFDNYYRFFYYIAQQYRIEK